VHGDVLATTDGRSLLVISEKARVHGKVKAGHVIINGEVQGPVHSDELLELQPKARVTGDVRYERLKCTRAPDRRRTAAPEGRREARPGAGSGPTTPDLRHARPSWPTHPART
jgi:hypothetical protein